MPVKRSNAVPLEHRCGRTSARFLKTRNSVCSRALALIAARMRLAAARNAALRNQRLMIGTKWSRAARVASAAAAAASVNSLMLLITQFSRAEQFGELLVLLILFSELLV